MILDEEFSDNLKVYREQMESGYPDMDGATDAMGMLCDNVYRRITDDSCPAFINTNIDRSGNIMRISQTQLDSGAFTPTTVAAGEFTILPVQDLIRSIVLRKSSAIQTLLENIS